MLLTGFLPSSYNFGQSDHPADNGYLFFVPRKSAFKEHKLYELIISERDLKKLEYEASEYAECKQRLEFMKAMCIELGFEWDPQFQPMSLFADLVIDSGPPPENSFAEYLERISQNQLDKIKCDLLRMKGVVLGIASRIFKLEIEQGADEPHHEVKIFLPDGLPIQYVDYIRPLGQYEHGRILEYTHQAPSK